MAVVSFDFPLRRLLSPALVLPLAIPSYLAAYAFGEFFDFTGPLQSAIRAVFRLPDLAGLLVPRYPLAWRRGLVMSAVLYPYVYLASRSVFLMQGRGAADVARTLAPVPAVSSSRCRSRWRGPPSWSA